MEYIQTAIAMATTFGLCYGLAIWLDSLKQDTNPVNYREQTLQEGLNNDSHNNDLFSL